MSINLKSLVSLNSSKQARDSDQSASIEEILSLAPSVVFPTSGSILVEDYGAVCDGLSHPLSEFFANLTAAQVVYPDAVSLTDEIDGVAFNKALAAARTAPAFGGQRPAQVIFPQGIARVNISINATNLRGSAVELIFNGCFIRSSAAGKVAFDCLGCQRVKLTNLTLWGDSGASAPKVGLQLGRTDVMGNNSSDSNVISQATVFGSFTQAAHQNFAGENNVYIHPLFSSDVAGSYASIMDGLNHWNFTSEYVTQNAPVDSPQSFTENLLLGGEYRSAGGLAAIWMANTQHHLYLGGYALATTGTHVVALYSIDTTDYNSMLTMDLNTEDASTNCIFLLTGANAAPILAGFRYHVDISFPLVSVFKLDTGVTSAKLRGVDIGIRHLWTVGAMLFDTPLSYEISGQILLPDKDNWAQPGNFVTGSVVHFENGDKSRNAGINLIASSNVAVVNTGLGTDERSHVSIPYPPLYANDSLRITTLWSTAGTVTNTKNVIIRIAASACPTPGAACSTGTAVMNLTLNDANEVTVQTQTIVRNNNSVSAQKFFTLVSTTGLGAISNVLGTGGIGTTNGGFININSITATSSADSVTLEGYTVELIPQKI